MLRKYAVSQETSLNDWSMIGLQSGGLVKRDVFFVLVQIAYQDSPPAEHGFQQLITLKHVVVVDF